jgi:putative restriction endonuclease
VVADVDDAIRAEACAYVQAILERNGGFISRDELESFSYQGRPLSLIAYQRGIWKPRGFTAALTILTAFARRPDLRPYDDELIGADGYARYKWRGMDATTYDNQSLRVAMRLQKPLIWLHGVATRTFTAVCPVWLVDEESAQQQFVVAIDQTLRDQWHPGLASSSPFDPVRRYAERLVRERLHQRVFRDRVLIAYEKQCALCRLRHPPLLDAAHIRRDSEGGEPIIPNGISMCAIHHRACAAS